MIKRCLKQEGLILMRIICWLSLWKIQFGVHPELICYGTWHFLENALFAAGRQWQCTPHLVVLFYRFKQVFQNTMLMPLPPEKQPTMGKRTQRSTVGSTTVGHYCCSELDNWFSIGVSIVSTIRKCLRNHFSLYWNSILNSTWRTKNQPTEGRQMSRKRAEICLLRFIRAQISSNKLNLNFFCFPT